MKKTLFVIMACLLLACPFVLGEYTTSTIVQVNVTNNSVSLYGEEGSNFNFATNNGSSSNMLWTFTLRRNTSTTFDFNTTVVNDVRTICDQRVSDLTCRINNISTQLTTSLQYYPWYTDCFVNLTRANEELRDKNQINLERNSCLSAKNTLEGNLADCQNSLTTTQMSDSQCKKDLTKEKNLHFLWAVIGAGAVFGYFTWEKRKKISKGNEGENFATNGVK